MIFRSLFLSAALLLAPALRAADLPALPRAATSFGAATVAGSVYIYGGNTGKAHEFNKDCLSGEFQRLTLPGGTAWESLPSSEALLGAPMAEYKGAIYRVGGMQARNAKGEKDDLRSVATVARYAPAQNTWETLAPLPQPRSSHDLVVFGDTLYAGGGWELGRPENPDKRGGDWHSTLVKLDLTAPEKGWTTMPQPFERRALAMAVLGDRIYFLGGMDEHDAPSLEVDWLEPKTGTWGKGPSLPDGMMKGFGMAVCVAEGRLIANPVTGKLYALSPDGGQWDEIGALQNPRFFHRLVALNKEEVLALGGSGKMGHILETEVIPLATLLQSAAAAAQAAPAETAKPAPAEPKPAANAWPQWRGRNRDGVSTEYG